MKLLIAADCETVDAAWKKVITDPTLPVEHETEVTLSCPTDHTNQGGDKAVCREGTLSTTGTPPLCKGTDPSSIWDYYINYYL